MNKPLKKYQGESQSYFDKRLKEETRPPQKYVVQSTDEFAGPGNALAEYYSPPKRSLFFGLYQRKKLKLKHLMALNHFLEDAIKARGNSQGLTVHLGERVDTAHELKDQRAYHASGANTEYTRINALWNTLHGHERKLFQETILAEMHGDSETKGRELIRSGDAPSVGGIGLKYSGYTNKDSTYAAGVSRLQTILDTFAEFYGIK